MLSIQPGTHVCFWSKLSESDTLTSGERLLRLLTLKLLRWLAFSVMMGKRRLGLTHLCTVLGGLPLQKALRQKVQISKAADSGLLGTK